jgi:hypothetical protein
VAIYYDLYLTSKPEDAREKLLAIPGFRDRGENFEGPDALAWIGPIERSTKAALYEDVGLSADLCVSFRRAGPAGIESILRTILRLLELLPGDAAVIHNGERTIAMRKEGRLLLSRGHWVEGYLKLVGQAYEFDDLPSL